jgi:hypothetical protein
MKGLLDLKSSPFCGWVVSNIEVNYFSSQIVRGGVQLPRLCRQILAWRLQGVGAVAIWLIVSNLNARRLPPEFASLHNFVM